MFLPKHDKKFLCQSKTNSQMAFFLEPLFRTEAPQDQAITVLGTQVKVEVTL